MKVGLVGCSKTKRAAPRGAAVWMYGKSQLFGAAAEYADANYDKWFILSSKYGLLEPTAEIETYDEFLGDMSRFDRVRWMRGVTEQLWSRVPTNAEVYIHAGVVYREYLVDSLQMRGYVVRVPLEGKQIGQQLAFYRQWDLQRRLR